MNLFKAKIRKLAKEINAIASDNPSHRLNSEGMGDFVSLIGAVNLLADRHEKLKEILSRKIQPDKAKIEEEISILSTIISLFPEGVLVCNAEGQIILLNNRAKKILALHNNKHIGTGTESVSFSELGHSISTLIDKNLIEHALDEINEKIKRGALHSVSSFVIKGPESQILRADVRPIINLLGQFTGFILILNDITEERKATSRADALLQSLTKSARSPLASIRAAIEAMLEYPEMDPVHLQQFKEIIHKESLTVSDILNRISSEYSSLIKNQRSLVPITGENLIETIRRRAKERLGILVNIEKPLVEIRTRVDSYSMIIGILFLLNQCKNESGNWEFNCSLQLDKKYLNIDFSWQGQSVSANTLRNWQKQLIVIAEEKSPLTLNEVLERHQAAMWSYASSHAPNRSGVRLFLPADDGYASEDVKPSSNNHESHSALYNFELLCQPGQNPELDDRLLTELTYTVLIRAISEATNIENIIEKHGQLPRLLYSMIDSGAKIRNVTWLITTVSDTILKKLIGFAIEELGPPPCHFAFIILGSEGRKEQTLKTDQDNAIIFEDIEKRAEKPNGDVQKYFLTLGDKVCTWLDRTGYDFCPGNIMAKNPKWCQPLSVWKEYFSDWIHAAGPEDLLHSSIFFDFRFVYGEPALVDSLSNYLLDSLVGWSGFFRHMTENAVSFKPPLGIFGNFQVKSKGIHRNCLNVKTAMTPIVDFARIYALHSGIKETNTQERLYQLYLKKQLSSNEYSEIEQTFSFIMQIRFLHQLNAIINEGVKPDNYINPKNLSTIQQKTLKEVFKRVAKIQTKISFEFTGESDSHMK
jgi:CBS domain-containing protein